MFALSLLSFGFGRKAPRPARLKILIADDNLDGVKTLAALLESEGHDVRGVGSSLEALRAELEYRPDVVILDLQMPDVGGYDLARWWRSRHKTHCPLLIAISGQYTRPTDGARARAAGFDHYLVKPYHFHALAGLIALLLRPAALN